MDKGLILTTAVLIAVYVITLVIFIVSLRTKSGFYISKWGAKPLWAAAFAAVTIYVLFYCKLLIEAASSQTYEAVGTYSSWYAPALIPFMLIFIITQIKQLSSHKK